MNNNDIQCHAIYVHQRNRLQIQSERTTTMLSGPGKAHIGSSGTSNLGTRDLLCHVQYDGLSVILNKHKSILMKYMYNLNRLNRFHQIMYRLMIMASPVGRSDHETKQWAPHIYPRGVESYIFRLFR